MSQTSPPLASDVYDIVEQRMNPAKRWAMMGAFWVMALISYGSASPVPSTKALAIVRKSDGKTVTIVDDEMAGEVSVRPQLEADLASLSQSEFDDAWGIDSS